MAANRFHSALLKHFASKPGAVFCRQIGSEGDRTISWADLEVDCGRFAQALADVGATPGDQVLIFLRHEPELYGAFFGAMLSGVVPAYMPCASAKQDPALYWSSHQRLISAISPVALITDAVTRAEMEVAGLDLGNTRLILADGLEPAQLIPRETNEDALALLQHSSGTTGLKKGVALSYRAVVEQLHAYAGALALSDEDRIVSWLPLYHDMGLIACLMLPAYYGLSVTHIDPFYWTGRPDTLFDAIEADRAALAWMPNFAFEHLTLTCGRRASRWDLSGVRAFINCSEPCKGATFDRFAEAFRPAGVRPEQLQCCYAMAETVFAVSQTKMGSAPLRARFEPETLDRGAVPNPAVSGGVELLEVGAPIEGITVAVRDEAGRDLAEGVVGEICLSGAFLFSGYNGDPDLTAERLRHGVYASRDLGFVYDGRLFILGRLDDLLIINGRNLYAHEVEMAVNQVVGIKPGRVVAMATFDPKVGSEVLVILAETSGGVEERVLRREILMCLQSVFSVVPKAVELMAPGRLIKTTSGKISRKDNLARYEAAFKEAHS